METSKQHTNSKTKHIHEHRHFIQTHLTSRSDYTLQHSPSNTGRRGGGVVVLINNRIKHNSRILHDKPEITSFESIEHDTDPSPFSQ